MSGITEHEPARLAAAYLSFATNCGHLGTFLLPHLPISQNSPMSI